MTDESLSSPKLSIGLDVRATEAGFKAHFGRGTGRYATELIASLKRLEQDVCELNLASSETLGGSSFEKSLINCLPYGRHTVEQQLLLPRRIQRSKYDLFHFFAHVDSPSWLSTPYLISVLDLIPLKFEDLYKADKPNWRFHFARWLENKAIQNSKGIIAISEATKADVVEILGIDPDNVVVTPLAVGSSFKDRGPSAADVKKKCREKFKLEHQKPVLLYVGGIDARKNVPFLLDVLSELRKSDTDVQLALVGNYVKDDQYPKLMAKIKKLGLEDRVKLLGFVSDDELLSVYQAADLFLFPSLYEGFGFPVLESMACGLPVIAGNNSSIPEVAGDAGVLLQDNNTEEWVRHIGDLLSSESKLEELSRAGVLQAKRFSWEKTAQLTLEAYQYFSGRPVVKEESRALRA